jgi:hypothetical protein
MLANRIASLLLSCSLLFVLSGCAEFFGTHEGFEEGAFAPRMGVQGVATFEVVGVSPSVAEPGSEVGVYMVSEEEAPVGDFVVDDFWFCTFDGEAAMLETGGNEFEAEADLTGVDQTDLDLSDSEKELDGNISVVTFTVPEGSVTGEGLVFTPSDTQYFVLGIQ